MTTPKKTRSTRADTAAGAVAAFAAAQSDIKPPAQVKLREKDWPFWYDIVRTRAGQTWTAIDLNHAANLAKCLADLDANQAELDIEGHLLANPKGTPIANPRFSITETLSRRAVALSRALQVHAQATNGDSRDQKPKNAAQRAAQQVMEDADDDLIARPGLMQ